MSTETPVSLEFQAHVATLTIQRESSLNALNIAVLEGISSHIANLRSLCSGAGAYSTCRCLLIQGAGEKSFVAGADIKLMHGASAEDLSRFIALGQKVMRDIETLPLPVIAVVQGFAIGGGLELALAADLIIASERAKLGQAEVNLGLIPGFGGTQRLAARLGSGSARRIVYSGESLSAEEAFRLGVVDYLVPHEQLLAKSTEIAQLLASKSPLAIAASKRSINGFFESQLLPGLKHEVEEFLSLATTADAKEGLSAFVEKRKAVFPGK